MHQQTRSSQSLAVAITKSASKQTYITIRLFADRNRASDAFRAYAYFRWVDDILDAETRAYPEKKVFVDRQDALLAACYRGESRQDLCPQEQMLADLVRHDSDPTSGLYIYLRKMMDVMIFDVQRCGRVISHTELSTYTHNLAVAVTEAMYYFIGHDDPSPDHEARYLAVTAAHIIHMLRDTLEDVANGYYNIPQEVLAAHAISPQEVENQAYRAWICERVKLARELFKAGRICTAQVKNLRCRLAGFAYTARFEWMLRTIERDQYCIRADYPERKSLKAGLWMGWSTIASVISLPLIQSAARKLETDIE